MAVDPKLSDTEIAGLMEIPRPATGSGQSSPAVSLLPRTTRTS
jgi:hypothetical protein